MRIALLSTLFVTLLGLNLSRDLKIAAAGYRWEKVGVKDLYTSVSTVGSVEANKVQTVLSEVNEKVEKIHVKEGDTVRAGQELMRLTHVRTKIEYEQSLNNSNSAEGRYENAVKELAVQKKLLKSFAVSKQQVENAERAVIDSRANRDIARSELDVVWKRLQSTRVVSPLDGLVLSLHVKETDGVGGGSRLATIGDVSRFIVRTKVDELDIRNVQVGQAVNISVDAFPDIVIKGKVASIASQAEREAFARVEVLIEIVDAPRELLKHNLSVKVRILTGEITGRVGIPTASITEKLGDNAVVVTKNALGIIRERKIQIGRSAGDDIEVLKGLTVGQTIRLPKPKGGA